MKERPIIFSGAMVHALLAGTKTQTRRLLKNPRPLAEPRLDAAGIDWCVADVESGRGSNGLLPLRCPYGLVGDRLWVRETFSACRHGEKHPNCVDYRADGHDNNLKWTSPIFMPRALSRITLEITQVRVQRLQDLSGEDAAAEGVTLGEEFPAMINGVRGSVAIFEPRKAYAVLWDQINGRHSPWASNPWLWVLGFRRVEAT